MSLRNVRLELEAKLTGKSSGLFSKPSGKIERKSYADGEERLKVSVRNLKAPDQSIAVIRADGIEIAQITLTRGAGSFNQESAAGGIPKLAPGQTIEVQVNGATVLCGELYVD